ncbi:MAG: response regulator transcription factor [Candidatus Aminicenantes bacterium]|nr:response regulator transcription factor [Candidatus Aminicenantes bacterium]
MARKTKILVIDDDQKLNQLLTDYLKKFNFQVDAYTHPEKGIRAIKKEQPDLIILDIMLPDMDGFEVCKKIRQDYSVPIIMLTARGEVTDRVVGLELGADDYLPKPFEPRELVARIQSVLRRYSENSESDLIKFGKLFVDLKKYSVRLDEKKVILTAMEFEILSLFIKNPGRVLTRNIITDKIHGIEYDSFDRSVDVLISRLRRKLNDDPKNPTYIKTIWGTGYKFVEEENEIE